ncbi:MAG: hypothetical protein A3E87_10965 [Gammaproteobacteria bacterium RIFCSPHIGHO2_12_FULL_35_23]|nr:MAG: hypothetical protein A3E87_10965 [Gammaproteobacteria bacterium RIFCSPHIGHO2_12_FULL_35_23]
MINADNKMRNTLLLGSGFSKKFGGYLPSDFFKIFNHKSIAAKLRGHLLSFRENNYDFEGFYQSILDSKDEVFSQEKITIVKKVITEIYKDMDDFFDYKIRSFSSSFSYLSVMNFIINKFSYASGGNGYIFSLNQDLLLERLRLVT